MNSLFTFSWPQHCLFFLYSQNNWAIVADLLFWPINLLNLIFKWWDYTAIIHSTKNIHTDSDSQKQSAQKSFVFNQFEVALIVDKVTKFNIIQISRELQWSWQLLQLIYDSCGNSFGGTMRISDTVIIEPYYIWLNSQKFSGWSEKPALFLGMEKCSQQQWEWWQRSVWAECLRNSGEYGSWWEVGFPWEAVIRLPKAFNPPQHELRVFLQAWREMAAERSLEQVFASVCVQWVDWW